MTETDENLIAAIRGGDHEAFGLLIERHQRAVAGFLLGITKDMDMAEEIAQIAFVKAYQNLKSFEGRSSFKTWVSRIAINQARSKQREAWVRRWLRPKMTEGNEPENWENRLNDALKYPDSEKILEKKLELERAMTALSSREREITALRLEGYALSEIAQTLGISEGTVKSTLFQATQKMRRQLQ